MPRGVVSGMIDFVEITTWTAQEALNGLQSALPAGWSLDRGTAAEHVWLNLLDASGEVVYGGRHYDDRLLYIDAYYWLAFRNRPSNEQSIWKPRKTELTSRVVPSSRQSEDLPDLDPVEITAVYSGKKE